MSEPSTGHSTLLALPRELRNRIWDLAFEGTEFHVLRDGHVLTIAYPEANQTHPDDKVDKNTNSDPCKTRPRWLLTSQQILSEGLDQFSRNGMCTRIAPHHGCWTCALAPGAISREALLIPRIRTISLHLRLDQTFNDYDKGIGGAMVTMVVSSWLARHDQPDVPVDGKTKIEKFFPHLQSLMLKLDILGLERCARPKLVCVNLTSLRALGTAFTRVHISVPRLKLEAPLMSEDGTPPYIAPLFSTYPRLQAALGHLGYHMCRRLGRLPLPQPEEKWPSLAYRESQYWFVSDHQMHPCAEYESEGREGRRWFKVEDSKDDESGVWNLDIEEMLGRRKYDEGEVIQLHHTGLRYWSVTQSPRGSGRERDFKRDEIARLGERSWTCEETGDVVWIEDVEKGVTGYARYDEEGQQQRLFLQEPPLPQPAQSQSHMAVACIMGRSFRR